MGLTKDEQKKLDLLAIVVVPFYGTYKIAREAWKKWKGRKK